MQLTKEQSQEIMRRSGACIDHLQNLDDCLIYGYHDDLGEHLQKARLAFEALTIFVAMVEVSRQNTQTNKENKQNDQSS